MKSFLRFSRRVTLASMLAIAATGMPALAEDTSFTIAVIPDTQNYMDYTHQKAENFPFDANQMFFEQMRYVAANLESQGGEIVFVTSLGDNWQHQTLKIDPEDEISAALRHGCRAHRRRAARPRNRAADRAAGPRPA